MGMQVLGHGNKFSSKFKLVDGFKVFLSVCLVKIFMISWAHSSCPEKELSPSSPRFCHQIDKKNNNFGFYYDKEELDADNVKYILTLLAHNPNVGRVHYNKHDVPCYGTTEIGHDDHYRLKAYFLYSPKNFLDKELHVLESNKTSLGQGQVTFITSFQLLHEPVKQFYKLTLTVEDMRCALQSDTRDGMLKIDHKSVDYSDIPMEVQEQGGEKEKEKFRVGSPPKKKVPSLSRMTSALVSYIPSPNFSKRNAHETDVLSSSPKSDNKNRDKSSPRNGRAQISRQAGIEVNSKEDVKEIKKPRKSQSFRLVSKAKGQGTFFSPPVMRKKQTPSLDDKDSRSTHRKRSQTSPHTEAKLKPISNDDKKVKKSVRRSQSFRLPTKGNNFGISLSPVLQRKQNSGDREKESQKNKSPILSSTPVKGDYSTPIPRVIAPCNVPETIRYFEKLNQESFQKKAK